MNAQQAIPVVIVTGLSGAGKSTALNVFEDLGFFCADGLPVSMVSKLVELYLNQDSTTAKGLVLGLDIRHPEFLRQWRKAMEAFDALGVSVQTVFVEAELDELMRRYATTRRPHPLESERHGLRLALEMERNLLEPLRMRADLVLDTTHYSIHDLRRVLQEKWAFLEEGSTGLRVHVISFGFKYGPPKEADLLYDLRFLPNPYFDPTLKPLTGKEPAISDYVLGTEPGLTFKERLLDFLGYVIPLYAGEGRYRLTVALGCTGGRHRSVATAELVYARLKEMGMAVSLEHRHIERG